MNLNKNFSRSASSNIPPQNKVSNSTLKNKSTNKTLKPNTQLSELDKQAFKEEIKYLLQQNNHSRVYERLTYIINHYLTEETLTDQALIELSDHVVLLSDVMRELERIEESAFKQREVIIKLENSDRIDNYDSDELYYIKCKLLDRISFDYFVLQRYEEAIEACEQLISLNKQRIEEDRLSLIDDKCNLFNSVLNLTQIKISSGASNEELMENLNFCLEIFNQYKSKLEGNAFKFFRALGITNFESGNYQESLKYCNTSLKYKEMEGDEESEHTFPIYKCLGDTYYALGDKHKSFESYMKGIKIKQNLLESLSHEDLQVEGMEHHQDIARVYEIIAEIKLKEDDLEKAEEYIQKSMDNYLKYPVDLILVANCYFMLGEINLAYKKFEKSIEYSKKYISAVDKFIKTYSHEFDSPKFDLEYFTKLSLPTIHSNIYKALKYIAMAYSNLGDKFNCKKYSEEAVEKLKELNKDLEASNNSDYSEFPEVDKYIISDYLNYKYELIKLHETMDNIPLAIKEFDEIILKINSMQENKIFFEKEDEKEESSDLNNEESSNNIEENSPDQKQHELHNSSYINKNYFLVDAFYNKADYFIKLERYSEAKKLLAETQKLIHEKKLKIEPEREEDIKSKINLISLKLRKEAESNHTKNKK